MAVALLGLGGNIGDPAASMAVALRGLDARADTAVTAVSRLFRTPPWGRTDQADFLNAAARLDTTLGPQALLDACLDIERGLKRERIERWGPRTIDLDLLDYDGRALHDDRLTLPHPRMSERAFVLLPLAEIAPELRIGGMSLADHLLTLDRTGIEAVRGDRDWWRD